MLGRDLGTCSGGKASRLIYVCLDEWDRNKKQHGKGGGKRRSMSVRLIQKKTKRKTRGKKGDAKKRSE